MIEAGVGIAEIADMTDEQIMMAMAAFQRRQDAIEKRDKPQKPVVRNEEQLKRESWRLAKGLGMTPARFEQWWAMKKAAAAKRARSKAGE
jgi:hypothetical protein